MPPKDPNDEDNARERFLGELEKLSNKQIDKGNKEMGKENAKLKAQKQRLRAQIEKLGGDPDEGLEKFSRTTEEQVDPKASSQQRGKPAKGREAKKERQPTGKIVKRRAKK
jgi:hypothetical protein